MFFERFKKKAAYLEDEISDDAICKEFLIDVVMGVNYIIKNINKRKK